ncbi:MAG: hypothetical protein JWO17_2943, partial [Actinomycetia bacterium]|nr:hypothetical protein [Actinomycetes bacterium]
MACSNRRFVVSLCPSRDLELRT